MSMPMVSAPQDCVGELRWVLRLRRRSWLPLYRCRAHVAVIARSSKLRSSDGRPASNSPTFLRTTHIASESTKPTFAPANSAAMA